MKKTYIVPRMAVHPVKVDSAFMQSSIIVSEESAIDSYGTKGVDNSDVKEEWNSTDIWDSRW